MNLDQVALEMAKVLLPQMGDGYRTYEELMVDAFMAARCFLGTARQQPVESPENSPASPVQHAQPAIRLLYERWIEEECSDTGEASDIEAFVAWADEQQADAQSRWWK